MAEYMPDFINMTSVEALRYAKQESGKTAGEIAGAIGVSLAVVNRYLRLKNNYSPSLEILPKLCAAMGNTVILDWLAAQTGKKTHIEPAKSRAEVFTSVSKAMVALGEVSKILIATEGCGIDAEKAKAIRGAVEEVKRACEIVQGQLQMVASSSPQKPLVLYQLVPPSKKSKI